MKTITINLGAGWGATIRAIQNGDELDEANLADIISQDVADRLGWMKTAVDAKPDLSDNNTWTGLTVFDRSAGGYLAAVNVIGELTFGDGGGGADDYRSGLLHREYVLPDSTTSIQPIAETFVVPQITANRVYTLSAPGGNYGRRVRIVRRRTADAFTVTVGGGTTQAIISASAQGWVDLEWSSGASDWRVVGWGGTVTSIDTTVP